MRIAIDTLFEDPDCPTGSIDYLRNVARVFPRLGPQHDFYFLVSKRNLRHFREFEERNLRFLNCFHSNENVPLRILVQQSLLPALIKRHQINVLFAAGNVCPLWGDFCRVLKINTLHQYHTPALVGVARTKYRKLSFELSARRADHIVANTEGTKSEICKFMQVPEDKITVIGEAFYDLYRPVSATEAANVRSKYGLEQDYILFVSVLYPYKNVGTLIKSLGHIPQKETAALKLVIVGRDFDGQRAKLQALANQLGVLDSVRFLGFVPVEDLPAIYCGARVFVFPSLVETFGKPLVEAMRCGVPVVGSNTSCIPEVLGGAGLLVNPLDPIEMASAISQAAGDCALRKELIERGFTRARYFSWEVGATATLGLIERTFEHWRASRKQSK